MLPQSNLISSPNLACKVMHSEVINEKKAACTFNPGRRNLAERQLRTAFYEASCCLKGSALASWWARSSSQPKDNSARPVRPNL